MLAEPVQAEGAPRGHLGGTIGPRWVMMAMMMMVMVMMAMVMRVAPYGHSVTIIVTLYCRRLRKLTDDQVGEASCVESTKTFVNPSCTMSKYLYSCTLICSLCTTPLARTFALVLLYFDQVLVLVLLYFAQVQGLLQYSQGWLGADECQSPGALGTSSNRGDLEKYFENLK